MGSSVGPSLWRPGKRNRGNGKERNRSGLTFFWLNYCSLTPDFLKSCFCTSLRRMEGKRATYILKSACIFLIGNTLKRFHQKRALELAFKNAILAKHFFWEPLFRVWDSRMMSFFLFFFQEEPIPKGFQNPGRWTSGESRAAYIKYVSRNEFRRPTTPYFERWRVYNVGQRFLLIRENIFSLWRKVIFWFLRTNQVCGAISTR